MQQTNQYKLNLIENTDAFSAAPLNENAEKLEAALAEQAEAATAISGVVETLQAGALQCSSGTYTGTGKSGSSNPNSLTFPFVPKIVFISAEATSLMVGSAIFFYGQKLSSNWGSAVDIDPSTYPTQLHLTWSGSTLKWYDEYFEETQLNVSGVTYRYIAIG